MARNKSTISTCGVHLASDGRHQTTVLSTGPVRCVFASLGFDVSRPEDGRWVPHAVPFRSLTVAASKRIKPLLFSQVPRSKSNLVEPPPPPPPPKSQETRRNLPSHGPGLIVFSRRFASPPASVTPTSSRGFEPGGRRYGFVPAQQTVTTGDFSKLS